MWYIFIIKCYILIKKCDVLIIVYVVFVIQCDISIAKYDHKKYKFYHQMGYNDDLYYKIWYLDPCKLSLGSLNVISWSWKWHLDCKMWYLYHDMW